MFCLVGGLYHAVRLHEAERIDTFLVILTVVWIINAIFSYVSVGKNTPNQWFIGNGVWVAIWIVFCWYTHGYAVIIR